MKNLITILIVAVVCSVSACAQTGWVKFSIYPVDRYQCKVDGILQPKGTSGVQLSKGSHRLFFHAPKMSMWDTVVHVIPDSTVLIKKVLVASQEYKEYMRLNRNISYRKSILVGLPMLATIGSGTAWFFAFREFREARSSVRSLQSSYTGLDDPIDVVNWRGRDVPDAVDRQDESLQRTYFFGGATVVSGVLLYLAARKASRLERPLFEDKEGFRFQGISYVPGRTDAMMVSIQYKL